MKKIIVLLFLMTFVIAMFPIKTKASTFVWKSLLTKESLFGGMRNDFSPVYHIEIDPSNEKCVYLATWGNGVLKSESNDFSFLPVNNGLEELNVHTLRVSPTNHDKIYAGTATGVFYSDNQGKTFSLLGDLRLEISVIEFGLNDTVYAGVLNEQENAGLYSFDGSRWVELGLKDKDVYSITRLNNSTLLIGTNAGLYEYDEAGKTFKLLGFEDSIINSIAISSKWIVLVTSSGIFKSPTDNFNFISLANLDKKFGENNFTSAAFLKDEDEILLGSSIYGIYLVNLSTNAFRLLYDPYTPVFSITVSKSGVIFLGVVSGIIWSDDNGVSFKTYVTPRSGIEMKVDPDNPNIIYVGAGDGLYRSVDGGKTFELLGLNDVSVFSIAINPQNKHELLIGTYSGLYKFNSNKNTFQIVETGNPGYAVTKVLFDPKGNIVIGVKDRGVFISEDGGLSFRLILKLGLNDFVSDIEFDPVNQNTFYVAACHLSYCNFEEKVYRTTDYGKNFESLNWIDHALYFYNLDIYIPKNNHNIIYLTGENIYRSDDGGKTFKKISMVSDTGLHLNSPRPYADILISYRLVSDPDDPFKLFLVSEFRIYIVRLNPCELILVFNEPRFYTSSDGGLTWNKLDLPNTIVTIRDIEYSKDTNTARILTGLGMLYYDLNKMTYKYYSDYFPDKEINFAKVINSTLFVGSNSGNIGKSNDHGETFSFNAKFDVPINNIYGSKLDPSLYFASTKIGVLVSTNGGETWARKQDNLAFYKVSSVLDGGKEVFYAITNDGLFRSYDIFENVEKVYDGTVKELMIDGQTIYFATDNAIFSTNDFKTFSKLADVSSSVNVITIQNGRLFIGTNDGLLVLDNGNPQSILKGIRIFDILSGVPMYLATDSGVIVLNDDLTYNSINNGLTNYYVTSITRDKENNIFVGTLGGGLFRLEENFVIKSICYENGSIYPLGEVMVKSHSSQSFTITPNSGFKIKDVKVDGVSVGQLSTYTFSDVTSDHTIEATFEPITFVITALAGSGGSITPSGKVLANYGESKAFLISPNSGYKIKDVFVDGKSVGPVSKYTFENITSNHTIEAVFEKEITQTVVVLQIGNSSFTVNGKTEYLDSPPVIKNSRTLIPIRPIIEALGGSVAWDPVEKKVTINLHTNTIELWIGKPTARVNGVFKPIDSTNPKVVPEIINGRTMLPLRFVTENLGCQVQWDPNTKTITITYGGG